MVSSKLSLIKKTEYKTIQFSLVKNKITHKLQIYLIQNVQDLYKENSKIAPGNIK
jgi:hypothetical protein